MMSETYKSLVYQQFSASQKSVPTSGAKSQPPSSSVYSPFLQASNKLAPSTVVYSVHYTDYPFAQPNYRMHSAAH